MMNDPFMPQSDESFHSFIYRICLLRGLPTRHFFNKAGQWQMINYLSSISHHFFKYGDKLLLDLLNRSGYVNRETRPFRDPTSYSFALFDFVHGVRKSCYGASYGKSYNNSFKTVSFCNICIENSIKNIGFGYFKARWQVDSCCSIHDSYLYTMGYGDTALTDTRFQQALKGEVPDGVTLGKGYKYFGYRLSDYAVESSDEVFVSPCMQVSFKSWLTSNMHDFPIDVLKALPSLSAETLNQGAKRQADYYLEILLIALMKSNYEPFQEYLRLQAQKVEVNFGVISRSAFRKDIYVEASSDCQRCSEWRICPANLVIEIQENEKPLFIQCMNNYRLKNN